MIRDVFDQLLYVGNALDARDLVSLHEHQIRAVVDLAINEPPAVLARDMIYCRFPINDGGGNSPATLELAIQTTVSLLRGQTRTLVACSAGMSRAPIIAAAALAALTEEAPDQWLAKLIASGPNDISPLLWADVKQASQR